jgi:hypothetical protein
MLWARLCMVGREVSVPRPSRGPSKLQHWAEVILIREQLVFKIF